MNDLEYRLIMERDRLIKNYKKRNVRHDGFNSGDLRRIQALLFVYTGKRRSLKSLHQEIMNES